MFSIKRSLLALIGLVVFIGALAALMPLVGRGQGKGQRPFARRSFYLTQELHDADAPLTACADGYHMASLWEIYDVSNLSYDTSLGFNKADSGSGPPTGINARGWIRTGSDATTVTTPGAANCNAWTSAVSGQVGTAVSLSFNWIAPALAASPWESQLVGCGSSERVWCVQD